jgi:Transposase zinc-binding domain/Putative transposase
LFVVRDRHCHKCQGLDEARWIEAPQRDLLPVQYFHVVFTVPTELHPLFLTAPPVAYRLLFTAAAKTLDAVARRRLGAKIGFTAVLHTWTQQLLYHPHIHRIVPVGGLESHAPRGPERWEALLLRLTGRDVTRCPQCGTGHLVVVEELPTLGGPGHAPRRARSP